MFTRSEVAPVWVAQLESIAGTNPACMACGKPLPRKGTATWYDRQHRIASFWLIRCPCGAPHIVFNNTSVLPPIKEPAATKDDPSHPSLL